MIKQLTTYLPVHVCYLLVLTQKNSSKHLDDIIHHFFSEIKYQWSKVSPSNYSDAGHDDRKADRKEHLQGCGMCIVETAAGAGRACEGGHVPLAAHSRSLCTVRE
jgi:hypothetical protein